MPELAGARHSDVDLGHLRLHLAEVGAEDAPPLLLVHGWPQHWWCWRHVAPALAENHRCLMPDLRGHGWSEPATEGFEKRRLAQDLLELLDVLGLERVGMIGHDWGGFLGWYLACETPGRLSGLLALSIPHPWPALRERINPLRWAVGAYQLPLSAPLLGPALMRRGLTRTVLRSGAEAGTYSEKDLEIFDARMRSDQGARTTQAMYRTFLHRELTGLAAGDFGNARTEVPVRLLVGEGDLIGKQTDLSGFESHAPNMTAEKIPAAGHFLPEERPDLVIEHAREMFDAA